ncbi:hypothetical protein NUH87_29455 [Pseudomonas batumici]|uniref:hypothetical protein n=1 Tax=Pseudomonas batumici TaxID=226910 RepID=UPI0030CFBB54
MSTPKSNTPLTGYIDQAAATLYFIDATLAGIQRQQTASGWSDLSFQSLISTSQDTLTPIGNALSLLFVPQKERSIHSQVYYLDSQNLISGIYQARVGAQPTLWKKIQPLQIPSISIASNSRLAGFSFDGANTRIYCVGEDNKIYEFSQKPSSELFSFSSCCITDAANAPLADPSREMVAFYLSNNRSRVYYYGKVDGHIHELAWTGSGWTHGDLTPNTVLAPDNLSPLFGFVDSQNNPNLFYISSGGNVMQLHYNGSWQDQPITNNSGAPLLAKLGSPLTGVCTEAGTLYVYFIDSAENIWECVCTNNAWVQSNLTENLNATLRSLKLSTLLTLPSTKLLALLSGSDLRIFLQAADASIEEITFVRVPLPTTPA